MAMDWKAVKSNIKLNEMIITFLIIRLFSVLISDSERFSLTKEEGGINKVNDLMT